MVIILSRMVWEFDSELVNRDLDWGRDVRSMLLWLMPPLSVRFTAVVR